MVGALTAAPRLSLVPESLFRLDDNGWRKAIGHLHLYGFLKTCTPFSPVPPPHVPPLDLACANLRRVITEMKVEIGGDPLPSVLGDDTQLAQVFQNLIENAIKFRREEPARIQVRAKETPDGYEIAVQDNGIGMESQYAERIFLMFQRLHDRTKYAGNGIGLAICKKIVERHGGRIWVESEPGRGSTFKFTLTRG